MNVLIMWGRFLLLNVASNQFAAEAPNALVLVQNAEHMYSNCQPHEAYKVARQVRILEVYLVMIM